jgi:hypothetical protein
VPGFPNEDVPENLETVRVPVKKMVLSALTSKLRSLLVSKGETPELLHTAGNNQGMEGFDGFAV